MNEVTGASRQTSLSLLQGMRERDPRQWDRFVRVYGPLVYEWCRRAGVGEHDAADVVQEVFRAVAAKIGEFRREQPSDSFHGWLWGVTRHKVLDHFRAVAKRPIAQGGSTAHAQLNHIPAEIPEDWTESKQEEDASLVYHRVLEVLQGEFEHKTWQAFWKVVVDEAAPATAAEELGMTVGAVYNAKYKVLRRLRDEFDELTSTGS